MLCKSISCSVHFSYHTLKPRMLLVRAIHNIYNILLFWVCCHRIILTLSFHFSYSNNLGTTQDSVRHINLDSYLILQIGHSLLSSLWVLDYQHTPFLKLSRSSNKIVSLFLRTIQAELTSTLQMTPEKKKKLAKSDGRRKI